MLEKILQCKIPEKTSILNKIKKIAYELNPFAISYHHDQTIEACKEILKEHRNSTEKFLDDYLKGWERKGIAMTYGRSRSLAGETEDVKEAFEFADKYFESKES